MIPTSLACNVTSKIILLCNKNDFRDREFFFIALRLNPKVAWDFIQSLMMKQKFIEPLNQSCNSTYCIIISFFQVDHLILYNLQLVQKTALLIPTSYQANQYQRKPPTSQRSQCVETICCTIQNQSTLNIHIKLLLISLHFCQNFHANQFLLDTISRDLTVIFCTMP